MHKIWTRPLRPVLAFLGASIIAAIIIGVSFSLIIAVNEGVAPLTSENFSVTLTIIYKAVVAVGILAAIPVTILIWAFRWLKVRRGWGDAIAGALLAVFLLHVMTYDLASIPGLLWPVAGFTGLVAGLTYWLAAGRPKPPYAAKQA